LIIVDAEAVATDDESLKEQNCRNIFF
jgi:hypothetical protein